MVSRSWYSQAVELLCALRRHYCLMLNPLRIWSRRTFRQYALRAYQRHADLSGNTETHNFSYRSVILTLSERKVCGY